MGSHRLYLCALLVASSLGCSDNDTVKQTLEPASQCSCPLSLEVDNLAICAAQSTATEPPRVYSSEQTSGMAKCEDDNGKPHPVPAAAWTKVRISSPCSGAGKVCFSLRHGNANAPKDTDCVLAERCMDFTYESGDAGVMELAPFAGWTVSDRKCAYLYEQDGGYIEFHAEGPTLGCGEELERALLTQTCPIHCGKDMSAADCKVCSDEPIAQDI